MQDIKHLFRVCGLLIDTAAPIALQHEEPDEMVVQITSIEDLRWALVAAERELSLLEGAGGVSVGIKQEGGNGDGACTGDS